MLKLKELVRQRLEKLGLQSVVQEQLVFEAAGGILKKELARFLKDVRFLKYKNKTLFIRTNNYPLASELKARKPLLLEELRQKLGHQALLEDIKIN